MFTLNSNAWLEVNGQILTGNDISKYHSMNKTSSCHCIKCGGPVDSLRPYPCHYCGYDSNIDSELKLSNNIYHTITRTPMQQHPIDTTHLFDGLTDAAIKELNYEPEIWKVRKDYIYSAIYALENGLNYAKECLCVHDAALGRTTYKNKTWAETIEKDILHMETTIKNLKENCPEKS